MSGRDQEINARLRSRLGQVAARVCGILSLLAIFPAAAQAVTANSASASTEAGMPVAVTLTATDSTDSPIGFAVTGGPSNGSVGPVGASSCNFQPGFTSCSAQVTYTPAGGFVGSDSFSFRADNGASSDNATASIDVAPPQLPPPPIPGPTETENILVPPNSTGTGSIPGPGGIAGTLTNQSGLVFAALLLATYPPGNPGFAGAGPQGSVLSAFDVRGVNLIAPDTAEITFSYPPTGDNSAPTLQYFDLTTGTWRLVQGSTLEPHSLVVDLTKHLIRLRVDATSRPSITGLIGTQFAAISGPRIRHLALPACAISPGAAAPTLRFKLSQRAKVIVKVQRRTGARPRSRCQVRPHVTKTHPGGARKIVRELGPGQHAVLLSPPVLVLRPGAYRVTVSARNHNGFSGIFQRNMAVLLGGA